MNVLLPSESERSFVKYISYPMKSCRSCENIPSRYIFGRSQNTVPIASTQVAIKGIVQHSTSQSESQFRAVS